MSVQEDELEGLLDFMVLILQSECLTRCYCRSVLFLFFLHKRLQITKTEYSCCRFCLVCVSVPQSLLAQGTRRFPCCQIPSPL